MKLACTAAAALALLATSSTAALAGSDAYIGEITTVAFSFCPSGSVPANGQILPIQPYAALYSLLGQTYGGDGRTNFALPSIPPTTTTTGAKLQSCITLNGRFPQRLNKAAKTAPKE
jgi:microcystin-dependent protein